MAIILAIASLAGCQRRVQLIPREADSTARAVDSAAVLMRQAQDRWETPGTGEEAAALSARILAGRLAGLPAADWKPRADALLDSLGIGAESAGGRCALAVSFFTRSDPGAGAWPYLFWCGEDRPLFQPVEGRGLHLVSLITRGLGERRAAGAAAAGRGAAVMFARRGGGGQQPLLMVWQQSGGDGWRLVQSLGPDSLGGIGSGEFEAPDDTTIELVARTYRTPRGFDECATCPHLYTLHRFRWGATGFERVEDRPAPSTYSTFVRFIQALMANDKDEAATWVANRSLVDQARKLEWHRPKGVWRIAPATDETPTRMVFFRGESEAYRVEFESLGDEWVISGFEAVPRTVE
jgi:hypothetical protein